MATQKAEVHLTPNGGTSSVAYFQDGKGNPVEEEVATRIEIVELDNEGGVVGRTYMVKDN